MVVNVPEFDSNLEGMAAVEYPENSGVCHALVSSWNDEGNEIYVTECGDVVGPIDPSIGSTREDFVEQGLTMCPECWPSEIVGE